MIDSDLRARAEAVLDACRERELKVATAESCTGGLISACLTDIVGSSSVFERGFVTYSNEAKEEILGVPAEIILVQGAVSDAVVTAMADGALENSLADISVAVTGIAHPTDQIYHDLRGIQDVRWIGSNGSLVLHGGYARAEYRY